MTQKQDTMFWTDEIGARRAPGRRVSLFLLYGIPLLNILGIAALGAAVSDRITTAPSIRFALPVAEFRSGAATPASAALVIPADSASPLLFFDGIRYRLDDAAEADALAEAISAAMESEGWDEIVLYADGAAPYATTMRFAAIARRAGARAVDFAIREEAAR